jgi:hypothetical protein
MDECGRVVQVERPRSGDTPGSQDPVGQLMAETPSASGGNRSNPGPTSSPVATPVRVGPMALRWASSIVSVELDRGGDDVNKGIGAQHGQGQRSPDGVADHEPLQGLSTDDRLVVNIEQ